MLNLDLCRGHGAQIRIRGLVQGVGFRPTVFKLAQQLGFDGTVINDSEGVLITLQASLSQAEHLIAAIQAHRPPLARIDAIETLAVELMQRYHGFSIQPSRSGELHTAIVADAATCADCAEEINQPDNRRYRYPFTNCTHCGPRLSIVHDLPYDRAKTSMASFRQCPRCQAEYDNPRDRRFHAQPNACPECGPQLQLVDSAGVSVICDDPITKVAALIESGEIVAIKGIGGFQLVCDAANEQAVATLRQRKRRPAKALALMARDADQVAHYCQLSELERLELQSVAAPIVILALRRDGLQLAPQLAPGQRSLGFMLPYSPLHQLLMQVLSGPVVMTSGNLSEEPPCIDNRQALQRLAGIADYLLLNDREILNRVDDSVLRLIDAQLQLYRRARGYAPMPIPLPAGFEYQLPIFAAGAELKSCFGLYRDGQLILSQHMGDLENLQTFEDYLHNFHLYRRLFGFTPQAVVVDSHPEYLSSKQGRELAEQQGLPLIEVQHHHAHIAACLADNGWQLDQGPVLGVAFDGLGFGDDGTLWGGEFLLADYHGYRRLGHLKPLPLPGGVKALREPWRNLFAQLYQLCDWEWLARRYADLPLFRSLQQKPLRTLARMIDLEINSPPSSSCGRLFDAVAAAVGLCEGATSYEGQAAIELEALIEPEVLAAAPPYPFQVEMGETLQLNLAPLWEALLQDLDNGCSAGWISARFHHGLAQMMLAMVGKLVVSTGIRTVALSGGVFQNPTLLELSATLLRQGGFRVLLHRQVPSNDGGLALGQAAVAAAQLVG